MTHIQDLQRAILTGNYQFTQHVLEDSLPDDGFDKHDALNAIFTGGITLTWPDDRGPGDKYEVIGDALDGRGLALICKFTRSGKLRIITAYEIE